MAHGDSKERETTPPQNSDYWAFLSYRHKDNTVQDRDWATWLQNQIEHYEVPADLIGTLNQWGDEIPERIYPIFRDEQSLAAKADLGAAIQDALNQSRYLVVLCSPRAVESSYVAQEIRHFKADGKKDRIIAAIVAGEPGDPEQECFPVPLRHPFVDGEIDASVREEPIAADFRLADGHEGFTSPEAYQLALVREGTLKRKAIKITVGAYEQRLQLAQLKVIAGILGVTLEQLRDRDRLHQLDLARKRARNLRRWLSATVALLLLAIVGVVLSFLFFQRSESHRERAETERNQAENILEFMTFQVRDKMGPYLPTDLRREILETVDGYYEATGRNRTGDAKSQVAVHFTNLGELALAEGDTDAALDYYQKSFVLNKELVAEEPDDPYWKRGICLSHGKLGDVKSLLGRIDEALAHYEAQSKVAEELIKLDLGSVEYRRDLAISYDNMGDVKLKLGRSDDALEHYEAALNVFKELEKLEPGNAEFRRDLTISYNKVGNVELKLGRTGEALKHYEAGFKIKQELVEQHPGNVEYRRDLGVSYEKLGDVTLTQGSFDKALNHHEASFKIRQELVELDPGSAEYWRSLSVNYDKLGDVTLKLGLTDVALEHYEAAWKVGQKLVELDPGNAVDRRDQAASHAKLGGIFEELGNKTKAKARYLQCVAILEKMKADEVLAPADDAFIAMFRQKAEALESGGK